jgi:hypothetical protein
MNTNYGRGRCRDCGKKLNSRNSSPSIVRQKRGLCLACVRIDYHKNKVRRKPKKNAYYRKNKAKIKERSRRRYLKFKKENMIYARKYYKKHKEEILAKFQTIKGRHAIVRAYLRRERAPKSDYLWKESFYASLIFDAVCHYCHGPLSKSGACLDAMRNDEEHRCYNVVPCCKSCNQKKMHDTSYEEMMMLSPVLRMIQLIREQKAKTDGLSLH